MIAWSLQILIYKLFICNTFLSSFQRLSISAATSVLLSFLFYFIFFRANGGQDQDEFRNNLNDMFESMGQVLSLTGDNTVDMQVSVRIQYTFSYIKIMINVTMV